MSFLALGTSFNYYVALFHKRPVKQGLFGRPIFLQRLFSILGLSAWAFSCSGVVVAWFRSTLACKATGAPMWIYYLISACLALVGIQLGITWVQMQVLDTFRVVIPGRRGHAGQGYHPNREAELLVA